MIHHFKSLVLVRKGCAFYATLYQKVFFGKTGGGRVLKNTNAKRIIEIRQISADIQQVKVMRSATRLKNLHRLKTPGCRNVTVDGCGSFSMTIFTVKVGHTLGHKVM